MNNAFRLTAPILAATLATGVAFAQPDSVRYVDAPVVDVEPIRVTERVPVEREVCWEERGYRPGHRGNTATGTIAGAIIGGVIGNQFGGGNGKRALTAAGAALGASIGHDAAKRHHRPGRPVTWERCEIRVEHQARSRTDGYRVWYEYGGEVLQTRMPHPPGDRITLEVVARPVG